MPTLTVVNAGLVRCPSCRCYAPPGDHRPGSDDCNTAREERRLSQDDD